ncbi:MAG: macro domain-containing protein [Cyanobacteria bacterium SZAS TMP-1]|nr:macro domain-containing protein [Cyanobacteria bacterium SZAS TMP-1]
MDITKVSILQGDLLDQKTDAIVNPWNQNLVPWWLLLPKGVAGAIRSRAGMKPFIEVGRNGPIPLGEAVVTTAGKLPFRCIIHVASINMMWRASEQTIRLSVINAIRAAEENHVKSLAFPIIGSGSGGFNAKKAQEIMLKTLEKLESNVEVTIVKSR